MIESEIKLLVNQPFDSDQYKYYVRLVHPDVNPGLIELYKLLVEWKNPKPLAVIDSRIKLKAKIADGDISTIYSTFDGKVFKLAKHPDLNEFLLQEWDVLAKLTESEHLRPRITTPVERVEVVTTCKRVGILSENLPGLTLEDLITKHYPNGLDGRHAAWIMRRLMEALFFVHAEGVTHGAILPSHIMINPETHGATLIGWGQSYNDTPKIVPKSYKNWYPENKKWLDHKLLGKTMEYMMKKDENQRLKGFATALQISNADWQEWYEDFGCLLERLYGPPKFVELVI